MPEEIKDGSIPEESPPATPQEYVTQDQFKSLSDTLTTFIETIQNKPALKDAGYVAPDDELGKPEVKSFADFLTAIYHKNHKRLTGVYKAVKDLSGETGTAGGYLVPEEFRNELLRLADDMSPILSQVQRIPVGSDTGRYPALDQYVTPTAGSGATTMRS